MTLNQIREELRKQGLIGFFWGIDDVKQLAMDEHIPSAELTDEEAWQVLDSIEQNYDCNYGVTWDNFHCEIENVLLAREED